MSINTYVTTHIPSAILDALQYEPNSLKYIGNIRRIDGIGFKIDTITIDPNLSYASFYMKKTGTEVCISFEKQHISTYMCTMDAAMIEKVKWHKNFRAMNRKEKKFFEREIINEIVNFIIDSAFKPRPVTKDLRAFQSPKRPLSLTRM